MCIEQGRGVSKAGRNAPPGTVDEGVLQRWREGNAGGATRRHMDGALDGMLGESSSPEPPSGAGAQAQGLPVVTIPPGH